MSLVSTLSGIRTEIPFPLARDGILGEIWSGGDTRPSIINDLTVFGKRFTNLDVEIEGWGLGDLNVVKQNSQIAALRATLRSRLRLLATALCLNSDIDHFVL